MKQRVTIGWVVYSLLSPLSCCVLALLRIVNKPTVMMMIGDAVKSIPTPIFASRGDLLAKPGRFDEAHAEFERAAELIRNAANAA